MHAHVLWGDNIKTIIIFAFVVCALALVVYLHQGGVKDKKLHDNEIREIGRQAFIIGHDDGMNNVAPRIYLQQLYMRAQHPTNRTESQTILLQQKWYKKGWDSGYVSWNAKHKE